MSNTTTRPQVKKSRLQLLHQYYQYTGFYSFVKKSVVKSLPPIIGLLLIVVVLDQFIIDFGELFDTVVRTYSPLTILSIFFASESLLGLVPPEIFIAWASKMYAPNLYLFLLALLSYSGGIVSYFIGRFIAKRPSVYEYMHTKMKKHLKNIQKWGGFLIIVGALLPIPFSMTSIAAGVIQYRFTNYLLFGLLRFLRFFLYALVIFNVV